MIRFFFSSNQRYGIIIALNKCVYGFELDSQVSDVAHCFIKYGIFEKSYFPNGAFKIKGRLFSYLQTSDLLSTLTSLKGTILNEICRRCGSKPFTFTTGPISTKCGTKCR